MAEIGYAQAIYRSGRRVWGEALLEIIVICGVSLLPLLGAVIREMLPLGSKVYIADAFSRAFLSGQLLFYALGLIATVVWQCNKDLRSFFPLRAIFNLYSFGCIAICSIVIGYNPELSSVNKGFVGPLSIAIFCISIVAYGLMSVISQVHVNVGKDLSNSDAALGDAVRRSRGLEQ